MIHKRHHTLESRGKRGVHHFTSAENLGLEAHVANIKLNTHSSSVAFSYESGQGAFPDSYAWCLEPYLLTKWRPRRLWRDFLQEEYSVCVVLAESSASEMERREWSEMDIERGGWDVLRGGHGAAGASTYMRRETVLMNLRW